MARTAQKIEGGFTKEQLREKHEAQVAHKENLAAQVNEQHEHAQRSKAIAEQNYKSNPTKKNYRLFKTASRRAI